MSRRVISRTERAQITRALGHKTDQATVLAVAERFKVPVFYVQAISIGRTTP